MSAMLPILSEQQQQDMLNNSAAQVAQMQQALFEQHEQTPFEKRASIPLAHNVPVIPLRPESKVAFLHNWQDEATLDMTKIHAWAQQDPNYNCGAVARAKPGGIWFFEVDQENFHKVIEQQTGQKMPETFAVRSSPGRGHFYFLQTPASIAMGNCNGKDAAGAEAWSARVDNRYVVGAGSIHPTTKAQYEVWSDSQIVPAPDWLIVWCIENSKKNDTRTGRVELDDESPIIKGGRNNALASMLGKARQVLSMDKDQLLQYGLDVNEKRCKPPLDEDEVRQIANSIFKYPVKPSGPGTVILGSQQQPSEIVVPKLNTVPYPVFPDWVMHGTSLYENFVKPVCDQNCRIPYFMFLPAAALMMNYLGLKVRVENKAWIPSFCMVLIGEKGRAIKSSSVEDACEYMTAAGILKEGMASNNADAKSLIWTAGSTEGLGLETKRTNCQNAILFYDELSLITAKAGIDCSSMKSHLLSMAESGRFANTIKSKKQAFNFEPRSYCACVIACTTNEIFEDQWSQLTGKSTGLDDRFMFLLQPEELPALTPPIHVNTLDGAVKTRELIDKAVLQKVYRIEDMFGQLETAIGKLGNRTTIRAEKWALYFAIDRGLDYIDEGCIERGLAIAQYEQDVKRYLGAPEAETKIAAAQLKYRRILERNFSGRATEREMERSMNYSRYGTNMWWQIFEGGLVRAGIVGKVMADGKPSVYTIKALDD